MVERTLTFVKPDAVERSLVGTIIARFEKAGFKIIKLKKGRITKELAELLYPNSEEQLVGMGNKTLASTEQKGGKEFVMKLFGTIEPGEIGRQLNEWNRKFAASSDVVAMVLEGDNAVARMREIIGKTDPAQAAKGTIRGDLGEDSIYQGNLEKRACRNLVHASDGERARIEIELFEKHFFNSQA